MAGLNVIQLVFILLVLESRPHGRQTKKSHQHVFSHLFLLRPKALHHVIKHLSSTVDQIFVLILSVRLRVKGKDNMSAHSQRFTDNQQAREGRRKTLKKNAFVCRSLRHRPCTTLISELFLQESIRLLISSKLAMCHQVESVSREGPMDHDRDELRDLKTVRSTMTTQGACLRHLSASVMIGPSVCSSSCRPCPGSFDLRLIP